MSLDSSVQRIVRAITGTGLLLALSGCATQQSALSTADETLPTFDAQHSRIVAWVPQSQAHTASAAQTQAYIALARAKQATDAELCRGVWMFSGALLQEQTPQRTQAPARIGGGDAWHLRIVWAPQLSECGVSAQTYAQTLSKHLPTWMLAQSTQPVAVYHRGEIIPSSPTTLACTTCTETASAQLVIRQ